MFMVTSGFENCVDVSRTEFSPSHEILVITIYEKFMMTSSLTDILGQDEKNLFSGTVAHAYFCSTPNNALSNLVHETFMKYLAFTEASYQRCSSEKAF